MSRQPLTMLALLCLSPALMAQSKPFPRVQAVPQPSDQVSFQVEGKEVARLHHGPSLRRPFIFPIVGPSGHVLTRMGHPHDPLGHSHHNSVWVAHHDVNGVTFWGDRGKNAGRIVCQRIEKLEDGDQAAVLMVNHWLDPDDKVLIEERRRFTVAPLPAKDGEWLLLIDMRLTPRQPKVTLGKTSFGIVAVRMAKTIGVNDGGGTMLNSEGMVNEKGDKGCFWKPAKWIDYSGLSSPKTLEGITLLDHPANFNHPSVYHVRDDGWMGSALTFAAPRDLDPAAPLDLHYGLYVHGPLPTAAARLKNVWRDYTTIKLRDLEPKKK